MSITTLLIPDFALILFGYGLRRWARFPDDFWSQLERMIYYVLFPALLFGALARTRIDFSATAGLIGTGAGFTVAGMALGHLMKYLFALPPMVFASSFQCAFRFNSYVGFAIIGGLHGAEGIAAFGLLVGFMIPLANVASVWALARHGSGNWVREVMRNPLIISTVAGLLWSMAQVPLPEAAAHTFSLLAAAALPMGLIAVGAGLKLRAFTRQKKAMAYLVTVKLVVLPAIAYGIARSLGLRGVYLDAAMVLAALPTASSAYILAVRMGGEGKLVASIIAANVMVAMITLPFWLAVIRP